MMKKEESWNRFEKTGSIREYLKYTACTTEDELAAKKETKNDRNGYGNRDRTGNNVNR